MDEDEALQDFVSAPKMVLRNLIAKQIGGERAGMLSAAPLDALLVQLHMVRPLLPRCGALVFPPLALLALLY